MSSVVEANMAACSSMMSGGTCNKANNKLDWILAFQTDIPVNLYNLVKWIIIVAEEYAETIKDSICNIMKGSESHRYLPLAYQIVELNENLILPYLQNIDNAQEDGKDIQMLFAILSNSRADLYYAVKEFFKSVDVPAKCVYANDVISQGLLSIATEMIVPMSEKFGKVEVPWFQKVPLHKLMVIGFDVYRAIGSSISIGGMVCTISDSHFSITSTHQSQEELSGNFNINLIKCCNEYKSKKGFLPKRIIIFRCGVDVDHLGIIKALDVPKMMNALQQLYLINGKLIPRLSYVVVANKIRNRMLSEVEYAGPSCAPPRTLLKNVDELPWRYHFILISKANQEVVKPTSFFVLHDTQGFLPEQMQDIINRMCHFRFDSSGIVVVPIPCIFAYKLVFLKGISTGK